MKKRIPAIILMFTLFLTGAFAANVYQKSINVTYGIQVFFNDQKLTMTNVNGNPVEPFVYQGTTYVPIRAISETFGADVSYDGASRTAYIYDDFTEIIVVAYKLNHIMFMCDSMLSVMETAATMDSPSLAASTVSSSLPTINQAFSRNSEMLKTVSSENVNYSLLADELLPLYNDYVSDFNLAVSAFQSYSASLSYSDASNFISKSGQATLTQSKYQNALDSFLSSFNWRTF